MLDYLFPAGGALFATLIVYGGWLCLRERFLRPPEQGPQDEPHSEAETSMGSAERQ
jgi:hypothetical protein